jgi:hypothetical protein
MRMVRGAISAVEVIAPDDVNCGSQASHLERSYR